jgi:hypothetical protein
MVKSIEAAALQYRRNTLETLIGISGGFFQWMTRQARTR